jgi:ElaB/YqjD/DUF883 family membrane-anchored ribosome-binding protein
VKAERADATNDDSEPTETTMKKASNVMSKRAQAIRDDMDQLVEDARALLAATSDVAGEGVSEARQRLAASLDNGGDLFGRVKSRAIEKAQATDKAVHLHPYQAMGLAFGLGAIAGVLCDLLANRCCRGD